MIKRIQIFLPIFLLKGEEKNDKTGKYYKKNKKRNLTKTPLRKNGAADRKRAVRKILMQPPNHKKGAVKPKRRETYQLPPRKRISSYGPKSGLRKKSYMPSFRKA